MKFVTNSIAVGFPSGWRHVNASQQILKDVMSAISMENIQKDTIGHADEAVSLGFPMRVK